MATSVLNSLLILALLLQNMVAVCAISHQETGTLEPPHIHLTHTHGYGHSHFSSHDHDHSDELPNSKNRDVPANHDHEQDKVVVLEQLATLPASRNIATENEVNAIPMDTSLELIQQFAQTEYFQRLPDHWQAIYLQICALLL